MIRVPRRAAAPTVFRSKQAARARLLATDFFSTPRSKRRQERHELDVVLCARFLPFVVDLFQRKCAYCETPLEDKGIQELNHYRPVTDAVAGEKSDADGYWWLAYEWSNLYAACATCCRNKLNHFPIDGKRARPKTRDKRLLLERPVILDPCFDHPNQYLRFTYDGRVSAPTPDKKSMSNAASRRALDQRAHRAAATIDILGLNRPDLIARRRAAALEFARLISGMQLHSKSQPATIELGLREFFDTKQPHAGLKRQLFLDHFPKLQTKHEILRRLQIPARPGGNRADLAAVTAELVTHKGTRRALPVTSGRSRRRRTDAPAGAIRRVTIENFKSIRDLTLDIPIGTDKGFGWKMLLGENGTGKTSVLQAIALALMGKSYTTDYLERYRLKPASLLRKYRAKRAAKAGRVLIEFTTDAAVDMQITQKRIEFAKPPPRGLFVRGFGAMRFMSRQPTAGSGLKPGKKSVIRHSLFDSSASKIRVNSWLVNLRKKQDFETAARSLKDLLGLSGGAPIRVRRGRAFITQHGIPFQLDELSAGFESVLVMTADIIAGVLGTVADLHHATGVVLVDEIDAHLHPRWKMRIVDSLRRTFPSMQFIVTTHEPLCLRGMRAEEVSVLERIGREVTLLNEIPSPENMRVDQLLTSNLFGLRSTIDPKLDEKFTRYYALLARPRDQTSAAQQREIIRLRDDIAQLQTSLMTKDRREELLYEAIDAYLAADSTLRGSDRESLPALRDETKRRVANLYLELPPLGDDAP